MTLEAKGIARVVTRLDVILTSPLSRARETARIAAQAMGCEEKIQMCEGLLPSSTERVLAAHVRKLSAARSIMLVGHEPALGYLASSILGAEDSVIEFKKGGLCRIEVGSLPPDRPGILRWHLTPGHLRDLGRKK